jgi:hypothetical protein
MSDTNTVPQGTDTSAAPPVIPPAPPPVVAPPKVETEPEVRMTPAQLKARLAEERSKGERDKEAALAAMLGGDIETAKALIAEAKKKDEAQKSEVQKLTEQLAAEKAKLAQFDAYKTTVEERAGIEFAALDDTQKAAVEKLAGTDAAARLRTIDALRPTWAAVAQKAADDAKAAADKAAADAAKAAEDAAKKAPPPKIPAPANTTPAAPPPAPAQPGMPTNHLAVWEQLKTSNPAAAALYRNKHDAAIRAAQRQATG